MTGAQNAAVCIRPAIVIVFSIKLRSPAQCAARERCGSCRQLIAANAAAAENASFPCDRTRLAGEAWPRSRRRLGAASLFTVRHAAVRRPFSRGDGAHIAR